MKYILSYIRSRVGDRERAMKEYTVINIEMQVIVRIGSVSSRLLPPRNRNRHEIGGAASLLFFPCLPSHCPFLVSIKIFLVENRQQDNGYPR